MSDEQNGSEWVNVSSDTGLPEHPGQKAIKRVKQMCVCYISNNKVIADYVSYIRSYTHTDTHTHTHTHTPV